MPATLTRNEAIEAIAAEIEVMLDDWQNGRNASPDQRDYVLAACDVLDIGKPDMGVVEDLANVLFEDSGEKYVTVQDIATFLYESVNED